MEQERHDDSERFQSPAIKELGTPVQSVLSIHSIGEIEKESNLQMKLPR